MIATREKKTHVQDQQEALGLYLQALFLPPEVETETLVETETETAVAETITTDVPVKETNTISDQALSKQTNTALPDWAQDEFQILFIDIDGMEIAIPMDRMSGVREYPEQLTQMPNQAAWVDGVVTLHQQQIQVVNTQQLLMPQRREEMGTYAPEYIVQLGNSRWGLACKLAKKSMSLRADQVRWSGADRRRLWVLGMVKKHLCALIDVDAFIQQLDNGAEFT